MNSRLIIKINAPLNPFGNSPKTGDWIGVNIDDGNPSTGNIQIHEAPAINRSVVGLVLRGRPTDFAAKFQQDWGNVGGFGNLKVTYSGGPIPFPPGDYLIFELQNPLWTFTSAVGQAINNGKAEVVLIDNVPPPAPKKLTLTETSVVDCVDKTLIYSFAITGGTAPYTVRGAVNNSFQSINGNGSLGLKRGVAATIAVTDSTGAAIDSVSLVPIISIQPSIFTVSVTQEGTSPTARVSENVNLPLGLFPITYSLDNSNFEASGNFPNLQFEETYTLYIKDKYGCTVQKTFVTPRDIEGDVIQPEVFERYFKISNANSLIFYEVNDLKPNYTNTASCRELVNNPNGYVHEFDPSDLIVQQFKSSYDFHKITMVTPTNKIELSIVEQSKNLRLQEKVDVKLFRTDQGGLGIYFRNGNTYVENTDTVNGVSDYDGIQLPSWGKTGQQISVDGIGAVRVKRLSRDNNRGIYLQTDVSYSSLTDDDGKVQANYNAQPYNTYEFGFLMSHIQDKGVIYIEAGFNGQVERTFKSELIKSTKDTRDMYLFQWGDPENKAGIVHQTGISHFARLHALLTFKTNSDSETYRGDNETFNLDQDVYRTAELKIAVKGHGMENKLHLAGGMDNFIINGIPYKKNKMESERIENTNVYIITATLETGGGELEIEAGELVLKAPLTSKTGTPTIPLIIPIAIDLGNGGLLLNGSGGFVLIDEG